MTKQQAISQMSTITHTAGQSFTFTPGQRVICNGFPGSVVRMYSAGMVEVRLSSGLVCVSASFPDCYPA